MLLVDPLKRITIPEVRCHPWFTEHLPRYLAVMQADTAVTSPRLDEEMISEVRGWRWWCCVVLCCPKSVCLVDMCGCVDSSCSAARAVSR